MSAPRPLEVLVVDMQPIEPAVGGGRLRLLGLYHALGPGLRVRYHGTFDWPGEPRRQHALTPELEEIDVPLSARHFEAAGRWSKRAGGRVLIDATFDWLAHASSDYVREVGAAIDASDVVLFSHPWCYPLFRDRLRPEQLVVYDSQNCEAVLRAQRWDDGAAGTELLRHVALIESELARRADATWVCSAEDAGQLARLYGVDERRLVEVPNGVFTARTRPPGAEEKAAARAQLGLQGPAALFLGSLYGPNLEAVGLVSRLAPALPEITFVVAGGVSTSEQAGRLAAGAANVRLTGALSDAERTRWLHGADVGLNPMLSGSGTNIKMFDFMAAGLPVVATPVGARGIAPCEGVAVVEPDGLAAELRTWCADPELRARGGAAARALACERYSWERISPWLGEVVRQRWSARRSAQLTPRTGHLRLVSAPAEPASEGRAPAGPRRVAVVSTWNSACGIAEYTGYLARSLAPRGVEALLVNGATVPVRLCRLDAPGAPSVRVEDMRPCFEGENGGVAAACAASGVEDLWVQYHSAFFSEEALQRMVVTCRLADVRVTVTCHDSRRMTPGGLARLSQAGARLVVHNQDEVVRLNELGAGQVAYLPMGVLELGDRPAAEARAALGWREGPVVATFGFLRPHKGLLELIQSFEFVRDVFPAAKLLALTALYPSEDSRTCLLQCKALLAARGLDRDPGIQVDTAFLPIDEVVRRLHAADVVVLPYHRSDEGASASAAVALAARRPVLTTPSPIFDDLAGYTYETGSEDPLCLGLAIANVLSSAGLREHLRERSRAFVEARGWSQVAARCERLLFAPGRWRALAG